MEGLRGARSGVQCGVHSASRRSFRAPQEAALEAITYPADRCAVAGSVRERGGRRTRGRVVFLGSEQAGERGNEGGGSRSTEAELKLCCGRQKWLLVAVVAWAVGMRCWSFPGVERGCSARTLNFINCQTSTVG